jgi:hypothetical protein
VKMAIGEADLGGHGRTFVGLFPHRHVGDAPQPALWPQGPRKWPPVKLWQAMPAFAMTRPSCASYARSAPR